MEEYAYILDHLPQGRPDDPRRGRDALAYGLGEQNFALLEIVPKPNVVLVGGERVYVGKDQPEKREKIDHVRGRVRFEEMTHAAQSELRFAIEAMVTKNEERFIRFYNEAPPITTRLHVLELLPGLGKKLMWAVLNERKKGVFKGFKDMEERVKQLHQPAKLLAHRIELEITDPNQKYHLFVRPPEPRDAFGPQHGGRMH
ncbi:MAG: DUF655 domain-containing protein [Euryarchaeota archaeon]|nr:DUF655 domain-containing protein [Euryarchaeota archaeon]